MVLLFARGAAGYAEAAARMYFQRRSKINGVWGTKNGAVF